VLPYLRRNIDDLFMLMWWWAA